jgi:hypothetical protein
VIEFQSDQRFDKYFVILVKFYFYFFAKVIEFLAIPRGTEGVF